MRADRSTPTSRRAYGAISGPHSPVPQPASSTSRLFDASRRFLQHLRDQRGRAVQPAWRAWSRSWRRSCRTSVSTNASDARGGTSRPEQAASMCRAMGSSGSSSSHSSKTSTALSTSPSVQCASASSLRASGSFGLQRDDLREADGRFVRPLLAVQQDAEVVVRVRVLGIDANGGSIRRFGFDHLALCPQDHTEIVVRVGMIRIERDRALGTRRSLRPARVDPAGRSPDCCASPPARARARGSSRSARPPARSAPADGRALLRNATRRHSRARRRGCCGRCPPRPPTARSAAARWRSRSLRPG